MSYKNGMTIGPCRFAVLIFVLFVAGCASAPSIPNKTKAPQVEQPGACQILEEGHASFYADKFNGRRTASG